MNRTYKWSLRRGGGKERCPQCGQMRFVPFVLSADGKTRAGAEYGRCDREQSCGYFRYPGQEVEDPHLETNTEPPKEAFSFPRDLLEDSKVTDRNTLFTAYAGLLPADTLAWRMDAYRCGTGARGECIYWQYDGSVIRTAKAILYNRDGHRVKVSDGGFPVSWLHKLPAYASVVRGKVLKQCFFGQHLLEEHQGKKVYVVEGEKTAVLMATVDRMRRRHDRIWLACGGSQMLKGAIDLMPLMGRDVTLIPDHGQYWNWLRTADAYGWRCLDITPLKILHRLGDGCDIWDCVEDTLRKEAVR